MGEEDDVTPRPQNADCIGADNSDQPDDVREPEPRAELSTSSADCHNPEDVSSETVELTVHVVPERFQCSWEAVKAATKLEWNLGAWLT